MQEANLCQFRVGCASMLIYDNEKLRSLRKDRGLSQDALAKKAGVSQPTISALEQGEPHVKQITLMNVANALGINLQDILLPQKGPRAGQEALEEAAALCATLSDEDRAAWLVIGKALLGRPRKK